MQCADVCMCLYLCYMIGADKQRQTRRAHMLKYMHCTPTQFEYGGTKSKMHTMLVTYKYVISFSKYR